jgi:hypothetical protein
MRIALVCLLTCAVLPFSSAQTAQLPDVQLWLTTVDRMALLAPQSTSLHFFRNYNSGSRD